MFEYDNTQFFIDNLGSSQHFVMRVTEYSWLLIQYCNDVLGKYTLCVEVYY